MPPHLSSFAIARKQLLMAVRGKESEIPDKGVGEKKKENDRKNETVDFLIFGSLCT